MGKRKNDSVDQPKKRNGCITWLAAFALLILLFLSAYSVFSNSGDVPLYEGVDANQATYYVVDSIQAISFPDFENDRSSAVFGMLSGTYLYLTENDYEYGAYAGDSDVWWRIEVNGDAGFVPDYAVEPISPELAIDAIDSNSMVATAQAESD